MNALRVALGINSGNAIFIVAFVALCGARQTHFSREGLGTNSLSQSLSVKPQGCLPGRQPSQSAPAGRVQLPRRGSFGYLPVRTKALPSGELARERLRGFSLLKADRNFPLQRRAFVESSAANTVSFYAPSCENGISERPQAFRYPEIQNNYSAEDAQSNATGILNRSLFLLDFPAPHRYNKGVKG